MRTPHTGRVSRLTLRARQGARTLGGIAVRRAWAWAERTGALTGEAPEANRFAYFGPGVRIGFPGGCRYGEPWISLGDGTLVGSQVTLTAGLLPGLDLGPDLVLRVGSGCVVGRGTHIVAHESITVGDRVFIAPNVYITDQNHGYTDPHHPIGTQPPHNRPVSIGDGCWIGTGAVILPGARLGRNVAVAAGAVVRGTFPDHCLIGGVPARVLRGYAPEPAHPAPSTYEENTVPTSDDHIIPVMIVGDSISHGSSGDWTWRYRLWTHLRAHDVDLDLVGPKNSLDNIRTAEVGDDDATYADPDFDRDHDAQWGRPYVHEKEEIEAKTQEHKPEYLLVLLGINDLFWYGVEPDQFEANLREFVSRARGGRPGVAIALGTVLNCQKAVDEPDFAARIDATNARIRTVVADLDSQDEPLVVAETAAEFSAPAHTWDGTHPNPNGEIRIAAAFADTLADRFGIGARYPRPYPDVAPVSPQAKASVD
ncbi:GDSL-type esterase/lipase family protein [Streptomyces endophyticus]|uniref:GDSL-type esterase/lipase family protein n=1 Tax=Streptomyces endophyticus TaxID=714166 RepID=A0ABU6F362_9ACTN|nr:GDSL-type esterase/lipase family protein [Streptomyces endophyticus]MEB8338439.1 GDSL-type esterase/lipase family protein [Streptomyces endophyticus]